MATLFSKPDYGSPATPDNSAKDLAAAAERERERRARGRSANILTSPGGLADQPMTSANVLLGA